MKNTQNVSRKEGRGSWHDRNIKKLFVTPIIAEIRRQRIEILKLAGRILQSVKEIDDSVNIIATEIKRRVDQEK